jgi:hypothetical protein
MSKNNNVIITVGKHTDKTCYHTDICFQARGLNTKRYITEAEAKRRDYDECSYCQGKNKGTDKPGSKLSYKLEKADPEEVCGND